MADSRYPAWRFDVDLVALFDDQLRRWRSRDTLINVIDPALGYMPTGTNATYRK